LDRCPRPDVAAFAQAEGRGAVAVDAMRVCALAAVRPLWRHPPFSPLSVFFGSR